MEFIELINNKINGYLWSGFLLFFLLIAGVYLSIGTRFLQIRKFKSIMAEVIGSFTKGKKSGGISSFEAMSAALGGTIGTGNITGVATALTLGGPGAIFWMWLSGLLCMIIKFSEVTLAVHYREKSDSGEWSGGPMYYIKNGLPKGLIWLAALFCVFGAAASFGIGNAAQVNAISGALKSAFSIPNWLTGLIIMTLVAAVIFGGVKRLTKITSKLVPFMALFYILGSFIIIAVNIKHLPYAFNSIFKGAFSFNNAAAGTLGFTVSNAMRYGVSRGVFTNEAGMGSAPIIHAAADNTPVRQGYWGAFEVFADTLVMCTITALVILTSSSYISGGSATGTAMAAASFCEVFGKYGNCFIAVSITLFAFASMIGWSYYGTKCCEFIFKKKSAVLSYRALFCAAVFVGATTSLELVWSISDTLNGLMAIPNLCAVILLSPVLFRLVNEENKRGSKKWFVISARGNAGRKGRTVIAGRGMKL